jgi:hypothetical protein
MRIQRRHQAAGRGAGDQIRPDASLFQGLDDPDVGETAAGAAAEREAEGGAAGDGGGA